MKLFLRRLHGIISCFEFPSLSWCLRCWRTWGICEYHSTMFFGRDDRLNGATQLETEGCFPLCEDCWKELSPENRLPYYKYLILNEWNQPELWMAVKKSVLEDK